VTSRLSASGFQVPAQARPAAFETHTGSGRGRGRRAGQPSSRPIGPCRPFAGDSAFYTWLYRIGINTAKNYLVSQGRRAPTSTEFDSEEAENFDDSDNLRDNNTPERLLLTKQIGQTVNAAMEALPEELRTAIMLRELEGMAYEEIARDGLSDRHRAFAHLPGARSDRGKLRPLLDTSPDKRW
jgi:RNA polymerase sigma-70 factor (ECF subfamily)